MNPTKLIIIFALLAFLIQPACAAVQISNESVDQYSTGWGGRNLARTSDETLWVVYECTDGIYTSNSTNNGITWNTPEKVSDGSGSYPAIAVDSNNVIHVVWTIWTTKVVQYKNKTNGIWGTQSEIINNGGYPFILIDSNDDLHVITQDYSGYDIFYVNKTSSGWGVEETVIETSEIQYPPAVAIDSNNNIHMSWEGKGYGTYPAVVQVCYIVRTDDGWGSIEQITDGSDWQGYSSIAIDSNDDVHISWGSDSGTSVKYNKRTFSGWGTQETVASGTQPYYTIISLDSHDNVHVLWDDWLNVYYRERTLSGWGTQETVSIFDGDWNLLPSSMWAMYPIINGIRTNIPETGISFVWTDESTPHSIWYDSRSLIWQTEPIITSDNLGFTVSITSTQNTALQSINTSFGNMFAGNTLILSPSFNLTNSGNLAATISATFTTFNGSTYGFNSTSGPIGGSNFSVQKDGSTWDTLDNLVSAISLTDTVPADNISYDWNARLNIPAGQPEATYLGTIEFTFS